MTPIRRFGAVDFVLFLYIVLLAGGIRAGYLMLSAGNGHNPGPFLVQDSGPPSPGSNSETDLQTLTRNIKEKNSFSSMAPLASVEEDTAHASPGYPYLLGTLARFVAGDQFDLIVRWGQCGLGALTAGLYYLFARRAFRSLAVGVLAGTLCALHPFWIVNTAAVDDGVVASFLLALVLFVGARASETGGPFTSLLYGLGLAGAALVRAAFLPFAFVALAWFLLRTRRLPSGWLGALLSFLGFVTGVAPWMIRNWQVFSEPTPIVDSAYLHVWMGNNPQADGGPVDPETALPSDTVKELKDVQKQPKRYNGLGLLAVENMRSDPAAVPLHRLQSGLAFLFGAPPRLLPGQTGRIPVVAAATADADKALASYQVVFLWTALGMSVLGLLGWRWSYGWRAQSAPAALAMIWIPLPYILSHAEALSGPRLPLDGVLLCYAAFALLCFVPRVRRGLLDGARV
jgi:4-amino-4-deoxy-L-arabinose transferase-like glycosyltransferase